MPGPQVTFLPDGRRLHLHHGPIDLVIGAEGPQRRAALDRAARRFATLVDELVGEQAVLRAPVDPGSVPVGEVARAMHRATVAFAPEFVTPMAAVAGAVADAVLCAMKVDGLTKAYVNNGGDVAIFLTSGTEMTAAIAAGRDERVMIRSDSTVRGVATSGWRGRSHSLGIADAVTVLARDAAGADAAATMIANRVDLPGSPKIRRRPACDLSPDSDLGARLVTVDVAALNDTEAAAALRAGETYARTLAERGLIVAALLGLGGARRAVGAPDLIASLQKEPTHA